MYVRIYIYVYIFIYLFIYIRILFWEETARTYYCCRPSRRRRVPSMYINIYMYIYYIYIYVLFWEETARTYYCFRPRRRRRAPSIYIYTCIYTYMYIHMFYFDKRLIARTTVLGQGGDEERQAYTFIHLYIHICIYICSILRRDCSHVLLF